MRAIVLLVILVPACAVAQDRAPAEDPVEDMVRPGLQLLQWSFQPAPPAEEPRQLPYRQNQRVELAEAPSPVCSVKLLEMPIPRDVHFTMRRVWPRKGMDNGIFAKVPAPACP